MNDENTVELIVELNGDYKKDLKIHELGHIKYHLPLINSYVLEIPKQHISKLQGIEGVKAVHKNTCITAQMNVARKTVRSDSAVSNGLTGKGIGIALLDTGIAPLDDFLLPKNRIKAFKDFVNFKNEPYDDNGHGTHAAYRSS